MASSSSSNSSLFSTITSFFSGSTAGSSSTSSRKSAYSSSSFSAKNGSTGSGYGYGGFGAAAAGAGGPGPSRAESGDEWSLPYAQRYGSGGIGAGASASRSGMMGLSNGSSSFVGGGAAAYPPSRPAQSASGPYGSAAANASLAEFTNMNTLNASSSNLVMGGTGPGRPSSDRLANSAFGRGLLNARRAMAAAAGVEDGGAAYGPSGGTGSGTAISSNMPSGAYPPLKHTWRRIRNWCEEQYPELWDTVNYPALEADLDNFEMSLGLAPGYGLPPAVRESFLMHNGQELESYGNSTGGGSCQDGLFFGMPMLSLEQSLQEWEFWRAVDDDPETGASPEVRANMSSCPDGWVRNEYSNRGWIPLITDRVGNYIGVDLNPPSEAESSSAAGPSAPSSSRHPLDPDSSAVGESLVGRMAGTSLDEDADATKDTVGDASESTALAAGETDPQRTTAAIDATGGVSFSQAKRGGGGGGTYGQVIVFGRDFDTKVVLWRGEGEGGWGRFLQFFAEELESGEMWTLDDQSTGSEDEEDNIGYEGYFASGGAGSGKGGGDRGGDGHAGFRLHGDYKGWPVLEAWADRSIRAWEEIGYQVGIPANQDPAYLAAVYGHQQPQAQGEDGIEEPTYGEPPSVQVSSGDADDASHQEHALIDPLGDTSTPKATPGSDDPLQSSSSTSAGATKPLLGPESQPGTPTLGVTNSGKEEMLSPPPMQPRGGSSRAGPSTGTTQQRRKPPPPAPISALDLPTLDDVRAAHAAALAQAQGGSHSWALNQVDDDAYYKRSSSSLEGRFGFFGGGSRSSGATSSGAMLGSTSLQDVVVDPASVSPRPSANLERARFNSSYTGSATPPQPGTPRGLTNGLGLGGETFQPLIDASSQPDSPNGSRRSSKLSGAINGGMEHANSLLLQGHTSTGPASHSILAGFTGSSLADADGRGSPRPLVRAAAPSAHTKTNSIKGTVQAA